MFRKIIAIIFVLLIFFLIFINFLNLKLLHIVGNDGDEYYLYLKFYLAIFLSILLLIILKKKYNIYHFFNLIWIVPIIILLINILFGMNNLQKIDYFLGRKINQYNVIQYQDRGWLITRFTIVNKKSDTLYYNANPAWEKKIYSLEEMQKNTISKSWITGYYYVSVKVK